MAVASCAICGHDCTPTHGWACPEVNSHKMHNWCLQDVLGSLAVDISIISSISLAGFYLSIWSI